MKRATIFGCLALSFLLLPCAPALAEGGDAQAAASAAAYTVTLPEAEAAHAWRLSDDTVKTRISLAPGEALTVSWTDGSAAALSVDWYTPPVTASVAFLDAAGGALSTVTVDDGAYMSCIPIPAGARAAVLTASDQAPVPTPKPYGSRSIQIEKKTLSLSEVRLLTAEEAARVTLPTAPEKVDLMLIGAHTGDEQAYFSGLLPLYAAERGLETITVFLSHPNRLAQQQAIEAQFLCGETNQPEFLSMSYRFFDEADSKAPRAYWGDTIVLPMLVTAIRRYRPEVIVTNAAEGEAGDMMHGWTSELVQQAVEIAATETTRLYFDSANAYGVWQVKKLYLHDDAGVCAPPVDAPLAMLGGKTGSEAAAEALALYSELALFHPTADAAPRYTLAMTQVGEDTAGDDLFEHIDAALLTGAAPTPPPVVTSAPTPGAAVSAVPEPTAAPAAAAEETPFVFWPLIAGAVLAAAYAAVYLLILRKRLDGRIEKKPLRIALCAAPAAVLLMLGLLLSLRGDPARETAAVTANAEPPKATQSAAPTAAPTPAPTATPHPWAEYFRAESDPTEVVVIDADAGRWEYRTDTLSILIDRHEDDSIPLIWFVAHIRMRDVDAFRPGFGYPDECGTSRDKPWRIARRYRAVLAITGDNLLHSESVQKGILIRKGRIYNSAQRQDAMGFLPGLSMKIYFAGSTNPQEVLEDGVENTFAFGPTLVYDGKVYYGTEGVKRHRTQPRNPRSGVGMVEPGHFVAIVVDGRQKDYSVGVDLQTYAQMFADEGCTVAFNMDGGVSAGMVFMGEHLNLHRSHSDRLVSGMRPWPDALMWGYSESVPSLDDPIYNTGNRDEIQTPAPTLTPEVK